MVEGTWIQRGNITCKALGKADLPFPNARIRFPVFSRIPELARRRQTTLYISEGGYLWLYFLVATKKKQKPASPIM